LKVRSKDLSLVAVFASLYAVLVYMFAPISLTREIIFPYGFHLRSLAKKERVWSYFALLKLGYHLIWSVDEQAMNSFLESNNLCYG